MAKVTARGCTELARTVEAEWEDISNGRLDHFARESLILRSDGKILRKVAFKKTYSSGPNAFSSSTSIAATIKTPREQWFDVFKRYAERRGHTVQAT